MSFPAAVTRACGELPPRLGVTRLPAAGQERPMPEKTQLDLELFNSLSELAKAENECTRCPLYKHPTQAVPGEGAQIGPRDAGR
jgi:hypothetical protein